MLSCDNAVGAFNCINGLEHYILSYLNCNCRQENVALGKQTIYILGKDAAVFF